MCDTENTCEDGYSCENCKCVKLPEAGISNTSILIWGVALLLIGLFFETIVNSVNNRVIVIKNNAAEVQQRRFEDDIVSDRESNVRRKKQLEVIA